MNAILNQSEDVPICISISEMANLCAGDDANQQLDHFGAVFLSKNHKPSHEAAKCQVQAYYSELPDDEYGTGQRSRCYSKFEYNLESNWLSEAPDQSYSQTYAANDMNGGEARRFQQIPPGLFDNGAFKELLQEQLSLMTNLYVFTKRTIQIGIHTIRYVAKKARPTYSSPIWLHRDDEPLVFLTVVSESPGLVGGDTILARNKETIDRVIHLTPYSTVLLTKQGMHMVTPMEPPEWSETGWRDILLVTVEEQDSVVLRRSSLH